MFSKESSSRFRRAVLRLEYVQAGLTRFLQEDDRERNNQGDQVKELS